MVQQEGSSHDKKILFRLGTLVGVLAGTLLIGLLAGSLLANRLTRLRYGTELDAVRAEQRRVNQQYNELGANYTRARELNNRVRTLIAGSTELLQSNDSTLSGLRRQLSTLAAQIQELKNLFNSFDTGGPADGLPANTAADTISVY
jgi:dsDNA-specific endonuclease/ATPase MutS2